MQNADFFLSTPCMFHFHSFIFILTQLPMKFYPDLLHPHSISHIPTLTLTAPEGVNISPPPPSPPRHFFDCCILTGRVSKLILYDCSSNFILNILSVEFFWSVEWFAHAGLFVSDRHWLSLIIELSVHCYTALVLEIGCKFGYLIAT